MLKKLRKTDNRPWDFSCEKCSVCGKMIKPRLAGMHKKGVCNYCRMKQLNGPHPEMYL